MVVLPDGRLELIAAQYQFAGQVHQRIEQVNVDSQGLFRRAHIATS